MRKIYLASALVLSVFAFVLAGCNNDASFELQSQEEEISELSDVSKILYLFRQEGITTSEEGADYMAEVCGTSIPVTKGEAGFIYDDSVYENISLEAATIISNFQNVIVEEDDTEQAVKERFYSILDDGGLDQNSDEYHNIKLAIDSSFELLEYLVESNQIETKASKFWATVAYVAKCVAGTVGSAGLGGLAGAGAGTVTLPIVGTVSGAAVGAICGGLVGAATFC
jgi:uncharacterized lipoprotein YehR (DUF1307 family)